MNLRAKCVNKQCRAYGIEKSVTIETYAGFGAPNDRTICRICEHLMRTTQSMSLRDKGGSGKPAGRTPRGTKIISRGQTGNIKFGKPGTKKSTTGKQVGRKKI